MSEPGGTRADVTRQKILDAAARRFATRSFITVSLDDVVADADVFKGALYFHFRSKHSLALAIIEHHAAATLQWAVRRPGGANMGLFDEWTKGSITVLEQAIAEGDVTGDCDPEDLARVLVSHYVGVRHVNDMDDSVGFITSVKNSWCATLPGFANPDRIGYLVQFVERRATAAVRSIEARR